MGTDMAEVYSGKTGDTVDIDTLNQKLAGDVQRADKRKSPHTFRLTSVTGALMKLIADDMGLSQTGVVELAVRRMAKAEDIRVDGGWGKK